MGTNIHGHFCSVRCYYNYFSDTHNYNYGIQETYSSCVDGVLILYLSQFYSIKCVQTVIQCLATKKQNSLHTDLGICGILSTNIHSPIQSDAGLHNDTITIM